MLDQVPNAPDALHGLSKMVKSREDVITGFHEQVNMSIDELQKWLDDPKSRKAGTGVGIESGHKIIKILKKNPDKDPEKYDEVKAAFSRERMCCYYEL